jgi:hypothetical protein
MDQIRLLSPRKALNKAYLKVKPNRSQIENFKSGLIGLIDHINENESEEFHKNLISRFFYTVYYGERFFINTKEREDLAVYNGKDAKSSVGVIIEAKKPSNKTEMVSAENLNAKALHELILYYLRERISGNNLEIKQLVATNIYEWFIFDATVFEKCFAGDKTFVKQFTDFEEKRLGGTDTDFFYKKIAAPYVDKIKDDIIFTHFDLRTIEKPLRDNKPENDSKLIPFYKIFSPEHLLKLPFANDSNTLDRSFYNELLHIIGLEETKVGSKKIIGRKTEGKRDAGSLIENAILILNSEDCLSNLKRSEFGAKKEEQLFNVALELAITWINRVLFLKLLEGQLVKYHRGNNDYKFLDSDRIPDYDALNKLFFQVLAVRENERNELVKQKFGNIPYLNSSLFEPSSLEHKTIRISNLEDEYLLPVLNNSVLTDRTGKRVKGEKNALHYLLGFLDAYDFSSEGSEEIQEENKTLINASVLGLIFEKINGYKDGSFFTPGFITMYMARETIRRAVVQKFNDTWKWNCNDFGELKEDLFEEIKAGAKSRENIKKEANEIINSLHICDPAVGSGHFLVSALNELIAVKSELRILTDRAGQPLSGYTVEIANDELIIANPDDELFEYRPGNKESQRVQETLFHEKQTLIENCLFGVDINPNSVKICRLRLWIELLKNAYYKQDFSDSMTPGHAITKTAVLETLPNIDINIKTGNSLISRYTLDADIKKALKSSRWSIDSYRLAVQTYREARNKEVKHEMQRLIDTIKNDFESEIARNDKRLLQLNKFRGELFDLTNQSQMFAKTKTELAKWELDVKKKTESIKKIEAELDEIKNNRIYENAFEWRFEFPEVLNNDGDFVGFDVVIGNPPYISSKEFENSVLNYLKDNYKTAQYQADLYVSFIERGIYLLTEKGIISLITPNSWLKNIQFTNCREFILKNSFINVLFPNLQNVFEEASVDTLIFVCSKTDDNRHTSIMEFKSKTAIEKHKINQSRFQQNERKIFDVEINDEINVIIQKIRNSSSFLNRFFEITRGVNPYDRYTGQSQEIIDSKAYHSTFAKDETFRPELRGKHIGCYYFLWDKNSYISYGNWLAAPRDIKFFQGNRIVMRQVLGKKFNCSVIDEDFIIDQSVFIAKPKSEFEDKINIIQGLLASKLIVFFFKHTNNEFDALFPKIKIGEFKELPIFSEIEKIPNDFTLKVNQILELKKQNPTVDTTTLEAEIDEMVYQLYGLNEEEIKIVENG